MNLKTRLDRITLKVGASDRLGETMARIGVVNGVHDPTHPLYGYTRVVSDGKQESVDRLRGFLDGLEAFGQAATQ